MAKRRGRIIVAAGTNGAGKSSIAGEYFVRGGGYFNPDLRTQDLVSAGLTPGDANAQSWAEGFDQLRHAIDNNEDFTFETTLGGRSISRELHRAVKAGRTVCIWYVGLDSPELHITRVQARVARGGHDIPEAKIRERYQKSLSNLIGLIGIAAEFHLFDNSQETDDGLPHAKLVMRMHGSRITEPNIVELVMNAPDWAKPVIAAALQTNAARSAQP